MPKRTSSYHDSLLNDLRDPQEAANYVNAAIEDGSTETLLLALRNVAEANKMARVAKGAGVTREAIYRMLSRSGNPRLSSLWGVFPLSRLASHGRARDGEDTEANDTESYHRGQNRN